MVEVSPVPYKHIYLNVGQCVCGLRKPPILQETMQSYSFIFLETVPVIIIWLEIVIIVIKEINIFSHSEKYMENTLSINQK